MDIENKYLDKLESTSFQPIFVLGFHRSGTSILYKILESTKCFNIITAYHVIKYDQLLYNHIENEEESVKKELNNFLKEHGQIDRGIDRLRLSANFPEEYRFIFTEKSYNPIISTKNLSLFIEICKKIQFISENDKPLLLKNPFDFSNFMFIKKVFPEAKFIFIHRNPIKVIDSCIKSINNLFEKKNLYTALLSRVYERVINNPLIFHLYRFFLSSTVFLRCVLLIRSYTEVTDYYLKNIGLLSKENYVSVRYEDLCKKPEAVMTQIMDFLGLKPTSEIKYSEFIELRQTKLLKELQILRHYMIKKMEKYLAYCGYSIEDIM